MERRDNAQAVCESPMKHRKHIAVGEKVPLELTERERDLIIIHTFADNNLTNRLRVVPSPGRRPFYRFTLDDLDELAGYVAAEANHAKFKKLEKELRQLCGRITSTISHLLGHASPTTTNRYAKGPHSAAGYAPQ